MKKLFSLHFCFKNNRSLALSFKKKKKKWKREEGQKIKLVTPGKAFFYFIFYILETNSR